MTNRTNIAKANITRYMNSTDYQLSDVYSRYSAAKAAAFDYCERLMAKFDGWGLKILSANTFIFTAGFLYTDTATGVVKFMYITPSYDTAVDY